MIGRLALLVCAGGLLYAAPAVADSADSSVTGSWTFETKPINDNCKLYGEMDIWKERTGVYACRFVAVQACTGKPPLEFKVEQTCSAKVTGKSVAIESRIDHVVSVKPAELLEGVKARYAPDNFYVTINAAGTFMIGMFRSVGEAEVRFWRREALMS